MRLNPDLVYMMIYKLDAGFLCREKRLLIISNNCLKITEKVSIVMPYRRLEKSVLQSGNEHIENK